MNILFTMIFDKDDPMAAFYDHFYIWFAKNLGQDICIKSFLREKYFSENMDSHLLDVLNPVLMKDEEIDYIFGKTDISSGEMYELIHTIGLNDTEINRLTEVYSNKFGDWTPDVIVSRGNKSASKIWGKVFPNALCLNQENAIFSRPPFNRTLSYDPYNSVPDNCLVKFAEEIKDFEITAEQDDKIEKLKYSVTNLINKHSPLDNEMRYYKQKFDKLVLLPLVGDGAIILFHDCVYDTEVELVEQVMANTPENIGVFVTQADFYASLTPEKIEYFSNKYSNFIYLQKTDKRSFASNSLHYFKYIDAVLNITSKTAFMALLWDKPVLSLAKTYNCWYQDGQGIEELQKVLNTPYEKKNNCLYWYFTRYVLFKQDFSKENFLDNYIQTKLAKFRQSGITFEFFEEVNTIDKVFEYILTPVSNYYVTNSVSQKILDKIKKFIQGIFSVKNENQYKVVRILGIKLKFTRNKES